MWFIDSRPDGDSSGRDEDDSAPGQLGLPAALLERHGARVLDPSHAVAVRGYPRPRSTVYRARTLLIPDDLLRNENFIADVNRVLQRVGMELLPPEAGRDPDLDADHGDREVFEALRRLPRPAVLVPAERHRVPVVVDAWVALQTLRAASAPEDQRRQPDEAADDPDRPTLNRAEVERIGLEHLLVDSAIVASPATGGAGGISGGSGDSSGASGPTITDSYLFSGGDTRSPVSLLLDPPARRSTEYCAEHFGRQPVVAVLDTGVAPHPWLEGNPEAPGGPYSAAAGGFVAVDPRIQEAIRKEGEHARARGDESRQVIEDAWDKPIADNPLVGELSDAIGHCTFIAGIVRQVAPDARVLAVRIIHSDGIVNEGDFICALRHLAKRIALAEKDDLAAMVDVVSLSFGYFSESRHDRVVTSGLWHAIKVLIGLGVVVAAAAGNYGTSRRFYPAAFAPQAVPAGQVPVLAVGALNPNGTKAMFSNDGHWVTAWAQGAAVVSAYPINIDGSRTPELRIPVDRKPPGVLPPGREALDPDDYSDGFAVWSGTSFSAPYLASLIAESLLEGAARAGGGLRLDLPGQQAPEERAAAAVTRRARAAAAFERLRQADRNG